MIAFPFSVFAADAGFSLSVQKYDSDSKTYVPVTSVAPASIIRVVVKSNTAITNLGGIRFRLNYNATLMDNQSYENTCLITDSAGEPSFNTIPAQGKIVAIWDTTANNTGVSAGADIFTFSFVTKAVDTDTAAAFGIEILNLYDKDLQNISVTSATGANVTVSPISFSQETLDLFRALSTIAYDPDILNAIVAAETKFAAFSDAEVSAFMSGYPQLYSDFINSRNKYNELAADAPLQQILAEVATFRADYATVLALTENTVKISDEAAVKLANTALNALSSQAKSKISKQEKDLLILLTNKVKELKDAEENRKNAQIDANDFIAIYKAQNLWDLPDSIVQSSYSDLAPIISEALAYYNTLLSPEAQAIVSDEKAYLDNINIKVKNLLAANDVQVKIMEKVTAFQARWIDLISIIPETVSIGDETALKLMLKDIEAQTKEVKAKLQVYKMNGQNLLGTIDSLKTQLPGTGGDTGGNSGDHEVSTTGKIADQTVTQNSGNTAVIKGKTSIFIREIPLIIRVLSIVLLGAFLLMIYPGIILIKMLRRGDFANRNEGLGD